MYNLPNNTMNNIKAVIFDLDGTIIDTEDIWTLIDTEFIKRKGHVYREKDTKHLMMGKSVSDGVEILREIYSFEGDNAILADERRGIATAFLSNNVYFVDGFLEFFEKINQKYKVAIGTSMEKVFLSAIDKRLSFTKYFGSHVYSIEDVGFVSKPSPDIFLHAANKLKTRPENCVVIEDSPNGVEAAKRAKMNCVAITTTTKRGQLSKADVIVDSYQKISL